MADQLPALRASRLPWHPIMEAYGIERTDWQALVGAVFPGAQSLDSIRLALSYCKRRNLDPFKHVIIVPVWDSEQRKLVDTIWPGIAELRTTAFRTQQIRRRRFHQVRAAGRRRMARRQDHRQSHLPCMGGNDGVSARRRRARPGAGAEGPLDGNLFLEGALGRTQRALAAGTQRNAGEVRRSSGVAQGFS